MLAVCRSDVDYEWVRLTRAAMVRTELKYKDFRQARPKLRANKELWAKIENGVGQATIVVIDPNEVEELVRDTLDKADVEKAGSLDRAVKDGCAAEIVAGTPVTYLPEKLAKTLGMPMTKIASLDAFTPDSIRRRIGSDLNHASLFAARAHATFDVPSLAAGGGASTRDAFRSPRLARVVLPEIMSTVRIFDKEHPQSVALLNEAADAIATALEPQLPTIGTLAPDALVKEYESHALDELQASDVAAGWAREMLETGEVRNLGSKFERVWLNGHRIK